MKKVKSYFVFFLSLNVFILPSFGQTKKNIKTKVNSAVLSKADRTIILLDTDTFRVSTTYGIFLNDCKKQIYKYDLQGDKDLLGLFLKNDSKTIYPNVILQTQIQKSRFTYRISDLLEKGECYIFNKIKLKREKKILLEKYIQKSIYGKRFTTKDRYVILETIDGEY